MPVVALFLLKRTFLLLHLFAPVEPAPVLVQSTKGKRANAVTKVLNIAGANGKTSAISSFLCGGCRRELQCICYSRLRISVLLVTRC